jgi:hypothetical protein
VLLVLSRDPEGKQRDGFFFTAEQVIGGPAGRWSIEDTFTNTRQAVRGREPIAVIPLALAAYRAVRLRG